MRDLGDEPALAQLSRGGGGIAAFLDHAEIAEIAGEDVLWPGETSRRQIDRRDRVAGVEADLHRQQARSFGMGLHCAADLAIDQRKRLNHLRLIEPHDLARRRDAAKGADRGRTEKAQARMRRHTRGPRRHRCPERRPPAGACLRRRRCARIPPAPLAGRWS